MTKPKKKKNEKTEQDFQKEAEEIVEEINEPEAEQMEAPTETEEAEKAESELDKERQKQAEKSRQRFKETYERRLQIVRDQMNWLVSENGRLVWDALEQKIRYAENGIMNEYTAKSMQDVVRLRTQVTLAKEVQKKLLHVATELNNMFYDRGTLFDNGAQDFMTLKTTVNTERGLIALIEADSGKVVEGVLDLEDQENDSYEIPNGIDPEGEPVYDEE